MTTTLDRPPTISPPTPPAPPAASPPAAEPRGPRRNAWQRYQQHAWIAGIAVLASAAAALPMLLQPQGSTSLVQGREPAQAAAVAPANLTTNVSITATEFKFSPTSVQVPLGQKVTFLLTNTGTVEHDVTVQAAAFTLLARAGQTVTGEFTFDKAGVFDFFCSIPGHKEAGMQGTLTVVDPTAAAPASATQSMAGMGTATASVADIKPLPANLTPLLSPQVAPPIMRTEPAYVKYDLTTQKVTAQMANGVAYEYWTFNGTVPGPMLRVREGDTVEIDLHNAADAGVTHSIDLHAVTGPGGGAKVIQIPPGEDGSFRFQALSPGVYIYHCATPMVAQQSPAACTG